MLTLSDLGKLNRTWLLLIQGNEYLDASVEVASGPEVQI